MAAFSAATVDAVVAAWINELCASRQAQGLTQAKVARLAGTTQSAISDIESGEIEPRIPTLARYAAAVGYRMVVSFEPLSEETT